MKYLSFVMMIFLLSNCDPNPDPVNRIEMTGFSTQSKYEIIDYRYDYWIGESSEDYLIKISNDYYNSLSNEIKNVNNFRMINNNIDSTYITDLLWSSRLINDKDIALFYKDQYYYKVYFGTYERITLILCNDSLLYIYYSET